MALPRVTAPRVLGALLALLALLLGLGWATRQDPTQIPHMRILGGGFMFNYRIGEVFYGFTLHIQKPVRAQSLLEASFEDPAGGPPLVVSTRLDPRTTRYSLRSPAIRGVEAGRPYRVTITLWDFSRSTVIERIEKTYTSQLADTVVPDRPLTIGPGYQRPADDTPAARDAQPR